MAAFDKASNKWNTELNSFELKQSHKTASGTDSKTSGKYQTIINWCLFYRIPKLEFLKESKCGTVLEAHQFYRKVPFYQSRIFRLYCYPNGDSEETEGYVSLTFEEKSMLMENCTINATFTLVDADGSLRFPQSFSLDNSDSRLTHHKTDAKKTFGLSRYMKRDALLSSDIFREEMVLIRCEIHYYPRKFFSDISEYPFLMRHSKNREKQKLIITDRGHPLWEILAENSPYFKKLLMKDNAKVISPFYKEDYTALSIMAKSILKREEPHFFHIQQVFDLYQFADRVLMPEYKRSCGDYLKEHMTAGIVVEVIAMADMHSDPNLKSLAVQFARKHWHEVTATKNWKRLQKKWPDLAKEVNEYSLPQEMEKCIETLEVSPRYIVQKTAQHVEQFNFYQ